MHPESAMVMLVKMGRVLCLFKMGTIVFAYNLYLEVKVLSWTSQLAKEWVDPPILSVVVALSLWPSFLVRQRALLW